MHEQANHDEAFLESELSRARDALDEFVRDLRVIDSDLEEFTTERKQQSLLSELCNGFQQLEEMGASDLFWGQAGAAAGEEHLRRARGHVDAFDKKLGEIEMLRQSVLEDIERAQERTEIIEDDLFELKRRQEEKKRDWVIERDVETFPVRESIMPWARGGEDDQLFRKALAAALLLCLFFGAIFPMIDIPLPDPWQANEIPDRLTRLVREERPAPPPPPPKPQETRPDETKPELAKESTPEAKPKKAPDKAPESKGILAFREKFSSLADSSAPAKLGAQARIRDAGQAASGRTERALVTANGPGTSGGINVASLSRNVGSGGNGIEGVEVARATSSIASIGGSDRPLSDGPGLSRTDEEIQIVFDRHKAALYRLYNRQLRKNPTLKGQMVLRITIEPDGSVSLCEVQSSDMKAPQLSAQVSGRVKTFDFGAKDDIPAITILYPIDFLPAT